MSSTCSIVKSFQFRERLKRGFTLVELLVVMAIIAILLGTSAALVPSLLHGNQMNSDVNTLAGILEQARSTAIAGNTYVYVGFSSPAANPTASPADGMSVIVFESQDGTDTDGTTTNANSNFNNVVNFSPAKNVQLIGRVQRLPGIQIQDANKVTFTGFTSEGLNSLVGWPTSQNTNLQWSFTTSQTVTFPYGFVFAPNGEARVDFLDHTQNPPADPVPYYNQFEFGIIPAIAGQNKSDVAVIRISRLTGKATFYRP